MKLADTLADIEAWLRANAPATAAELGPPATDADLDHVRQSLGLEPPADLITLLRWHNGCGDTDQPMPVGPWYGMLSAQDIVTITAQNRSVGDSTTAPSPWKPSWLVVGSDFCGAYLVVETATATEDTGRPMGSVFTFDWEDGMPSRRTWASMADTLTDMLTRLQNGSDPDGTPVEVSEDGHLDW